MSEMSGYRIMWLIALFDLPVLTKRQRKDARLFRDQLLDDGFSMVQLSVYFKYCRDSEQADSVARKIAGRVPRGGRVDVMTITDRQYSNIICIRDRVRLTRENPPQLALF